MLGLSVIGRTRLAHRLTLTRRQHGPHLGRTAGIPTHALGGHVARNWEATRERVRQWHALIERCRTLLDTFGTVDDATAVDLLLAYFPSQIRSVREARNALDYVYGRKGRKR